MANNRNLLCGVAPLALMFTASLAIPANAADLPVAPVAAPVADPFSFQGFYIGGHAGYGSAEYSGIWDGGSPPQSFDNAGYLFGLHAGYNWRFSESFYAGVEGDITVAPWNASKSETGTYHIFGHLTGIASLRGRLGYQFDRTMIYATGGVAFASSNAGGGDTLQINSKAEMVVGPVAGLGFEWLLTPNIAVRGEGLYYWFDQRDSVLNKSAYAGIQDTWLLRAGASYYFGDTADNAVFTPTVMSEAFSGFYIGAHTGYGSAEYTGVTSPAGQHHRFDNAGYLVGLHAGRNWRYGSNTVLGVEGDVTVAPWDAAESALDSSSRFVSGNLTGIASLRGRLGYTFDRTLLYATGGIAFASSQGAGGYTIVHNKRPQMVVGPVAGAGIEWLATPHIGLRAEGLYYWFDQSQGGNGGTGNGGIQDTWLARVGANYYFDGAGDADPAPVAADYRGFYMGVNTGYGASQYTGRTNDSAGTQIFGPDPAGYHIGAHIGYNWLATANALLGVEADMSLTPWDSAEGSADNSTSFVSGHLNGIASLRGRLGYVFDRSLIFATGGVAFASSNASGGVTVQFNRKAEIVVGPVAGAGLEWMATENVSLRAEGLYYWFDQRQGGNSDDTGAYGGIENAWLARIGATWHYN